MFRIDNLTVTTTNGTPFTGEEACALARMIFKRFGEDPESATAAWRRMLQNGTYVSEFMDLVNYEPFVPEKVKFISDLTGSIAKELSDKVRTGAIPSNWDGHELRQLLADKFTFEVSSTMRDRRSRRVKEYRNTVIVQNL